MAEMPENCIDAIVTDPPYGLEFMGKEWDKLFTKRDGRPQNLPPDKYKKEHGTTPYLQAKVDKYVGGMQAQVWHYKWAVEALRVARPGAHMVAFGGDRTHEAYRGGDRYPRRPQIPDQDGTLLGDKLSQAGKRYFKEGRWLR
jgi:site-specific DNA-methyltransferase (adenine-specific)